MVTSSKDFRPDCAQCAGLCCVAYAFDASDDFAIDKPADVPCPNLEESYLCRIHDRLEDEGFAGCVRYDCLGAGQLVTQQIFQGQGWHGTPALFSPMMETFRKAREVQSLRAMLFAARRLPLTDSENHTRMDLLAKCNPKDGWSHEWIDTLLQGPLPKRIQSFLQDLRHHVETAARKK